MASEDPMAMFADMKKKKKKAKAVVFDESGPGPDADPTYNPQEPVHDPAVLGPTTVHEQTATKAAETTQEEDDMNALFGDLKKKKKKVKKDVTLDAVSVGNLFDLEWSNLTAGKQDEPAPAPEAAAIDDLPDFGEIKKKKKKKVIDMDLVSIYSDRLSPRNWSHQVVQDEAAPAEAAPAAEGDAEAGEIKKKKKKKAFDEVCCSILLTFCERPY